MQTDKWITKRRWEQRIVYLSDDAHLNIESLKEDVKIKEYFHDALGSDSDDYAGSSEPRRGWQAPSSSAACVRSLRDENRPRMEAQSYRKRSAQRARHRMCAWSW